MEELPTQSSGDVPVVFLTSGPDGAIRDWNDAAATAAGSGGLADATLSDLLGEDAGDALAGALERGTATFEAVPGSHGTATYAFTVTRLAGGSDAAFAVTGRPTADTPADESSLDRMTDAFFAVDADWTLTYVNERARSFLSDAMDAAYTREEMVGRHLWTEIPDAVDTAFYDAYHEAMATQEPVRLEERYEPLDAWLEVHAYPSETGLSVYFRDVTERRERREALEERGRVLRSIHEVTADTTRSFDEQVAALLDIGRDVLGVDYGTLSRIHGDDYVFEHVSAPPDADLDAGDVVPVETTNCERVAVTERTLVLADVAADAPDLADRSGNADWGISSYVGAPIFVGDDTYGTFCFYDMDAREDDFDEWQVTVVDLMAQWAGYELAGRRIRDRLRRQNERLDDFASVVSHDLRNPLNVLDGYLDLAEESGDPEHFRQCRETVDRMESLVDELLALARAGEEISEFEAVELDALVDRCWSTVETEDATLVVDAPHTIRADSGRLRQVFENLLLNAVEHGGDSVTVTVGDLGTGGDFYVADDGPGISEDERDDVFDAGHTTSDDGTGFGLYIVARVAEAHSWTVSVTESEGGGARFEFRGVEPADV